MAKKENVKGKTKVIATEAISKKDNLERIERESLLGLTKEALVDLLLNTKNGIKQVNLERLDKESLGLLKKQWNAWVKLIGSNFTVKTRVLVEGDLYFSGQTHFTDDISLSGVRCVVDQTEDDLEEIILDKNVPTIKNRLKKLNIEAAKTRRVVTEVAEKAGMNPEEFLRYLETHYDISGIE